MSVKERTATRSPNFPRFYQFEPRDSDICAECPAKLGTGEWSNVPSRCLGAPVHTNWKADGGRIDIVYICESPSNKETSHDLPSVGATGRGVYKALFGNVVAGWLDILDDRVYRTNIVRCQADAGLQKRTDNTTKNRRVRAAFTFCQRHLREELAKVFSKCIRDGVDRMKVVIAVGDGFPAQVQTVKNLVAEIKPAELEVTVLESHHPSA